MNNNEEDKIDTRRYAQHGIKNLTRSQEISDSRKSFLQLKN